MDKDDKKLAQIRTLLEEVEEKIERIRRLIFEQVYYEQARSLENSSSGSSTIIEGVFDGKEMIDPAGRKYPVPENYASKSKLVGGDALKLTIAPDGTFIFKQIRPVERKKMIGTLSKLKDYWQVECTGKKYHVLQAAVTYLKASSGDKLTIIIPKTGEASWAAIENVLVHENLSKTKKNV